VSVASLIDGRELDVAEALGAAIVGVGGQTDTQDGTLLTEDVTESILGGAEGQVANEQSVALGAGRVTVALGTGLGTVTTLLVVLAASGVVQVDGTAVDLDTLLGLEGLGGIGSVGILDVTEAVGKRRISILENSRRGRGCMITYPRERPESRSVTMRQPVSSPNSANSRWSQSSSTFQDRLPMNRLAEAPSGAASVLDFLAAATGSSSALRFLEGFSSASDSESELSELSEPDSDSEDSYCKKTS
jgi:hypothetical protein